MITTLKRYLSRHPMLHALARLLTLHRVYPIFLEYPVQGAPRYGYTQPPHPEITRILEKNRARYMEFLSRCLEYREQLARIHRSRDDGINPYWQNPMFSGIDAVSLYCTLAIYSPKRYIEIGSGHSTRFARLAIRNNNLPTRVISIDPTPRAAIAALVDEHIQQPLESADLSIFQTLESGDVLFIDNSHRVFMNSDATVTFLEILPRLKHGVLVHLHDIALPYDYPPQWQHRFFSEQYMLAVQLLSGASTMDIFCPCSYISSDDSLKTTLSPLWSMPEMNGIQTSGFSFWYRNINHPERSGLA